MDTHGVPRCCTNKISEEYVRITGLKSKSSLETLLSKSMASLL